MTWLGLWICADLTIAAVARVFGWFGERGVVERDNSTGGGRRAGGNAAPVTTPTPAAREAVYEAEAVAGKTRATARKKVSAVGSVLGPAWQRHLPPEDKKEMTAEEVRAALAKGVPVYAAQKQM